MPRASVIIPTHNRAHLVERAVRSAREAGRDIEVIVVDDASTDETSKVCRALEGIKYIRLERNQGVAGARNVGILASTSDYIAFLDDDDQRLPGTLDIQVDALSSNPEAAFVCAPVLLADEDGVPSGEVVSPPLTGGDIFWEVIELGFFLLPAAVVVRKSAFFSVGLFNSRLSGIDDWDIWVRMTELYPVIVLGEPVSIYRQPTPYSGQGLSSPAPLLLKAVRHQKELLRLPRAQSAEASQRRRAKKQIRKRVADSLSWQAARRLPEGAYRFALNNFLTALRLSPMWAARPEHLRQFCGSCLAQDEKRRESAATHRGLAEKR
jgi:hypothetical protein